MPSELRLHPLSILFELFAQLRRFVLPVLLGAVSASTWGLSWQTVLPILVVPIAVYSITRYLTFRYRYEPNELVVRTGLFFRKERHIPYARIQSLDAVQGVLHRAAGVVQIRLQTGGGPEPEAIMNVLPFAAVADLRRRVFEGREPPRPGGEAASRPGDGIVIETGDSSPADTVERRAAGEPGERLLLHLTPRELLIYGLIQNRGMVLIAAGLGFLWELGIVESVAERVFGEGSWARGLVREVVVGVFGDTGVPLGRLALAVAALAGVLVFARLLSMGWAFVRLHDFRLTRAGDDLRTAFGLLTRVSATIPVRRVQKLTIHETPLHRLAGRVAVEVDTAGGTPGGETEAADRQWLAPLVRSDRLDALVAEVLPEFDLAGVGWNPVAGGAVRRVVKESGAVALGASVPFFFALGWGGLPLLAIFAIWAWVYADRYVACLGWAVGDGTVAFRSGWLWRRTSVARFAKIQVVSLRETPFDRRREMARVRVDTAGASSGSHDIQIPYLPAATARRIGEELALQAARTAFRW